MVYVNVYLIAVKGNAMGRKPISKKDLRVAATTRLVPAVKKDVEARAKRQGCTPSAWIAEAIAMRIEAESVEVKPSRPRTS